MDKITNMLLIKNDNESDVKICFYRESTRHRYYYLKPGSSRSRLNDVIDDYFQADFTVIKQYGVSVYYKRLV
jgi:hypothetical protein